MNSVVVAPVEVIDLKQAPVPAAIRVHVFVHRARVVVGLALNQTDPVLQRVIGKSMSVPQLQRQLTSSKNFA